MLRKFLHRLLARVRSEGGEESETGGFVPSVLDASVRYAHGGHGNELEGTLADIDEEARTLESHRK